MTNGYAFDKVLPKPPSPTLSKKEKYWCEDCQQGFANIRQYLNHFEFHKKSIVESTKAYEEKNKSSKGFFLTRLLGKVMNKDKGEKQMAKEEVKETAQDEQKIDEMDMRLNSIESSFEQMNKGIHQLTEMVANMDRHKKPIATEDIDLNDEEEDFETLTSEAGKKRLRITVIVPEKASGEFLKTIQDSKSYEMENIEVVKKSK